MACRGSWMPGASEVFGCPQIKIFFHINVEKILTTDFLVIYSNFYFIFTIHLHKKFFFSHLPKFSVFFILWDVPIRMPSVITYTFFKENWVVGCPQARWPGPSHPPHPASARHCPDMAFVGAEKFSEIYITLHYSLNFDLVSLGATKIVIVGRGGSVVSPVRCLPPGGSQVRIPLQPPCRYLWQACSASAC